MPNTQFDRRPIDDIEARQLERLARSILDQTSGDLAEVMRSNPALVREWISEMRTRRDALESEASTLTKALHKVLRTHPANGAAVA